MNFYNHNFTKSQFSQFYFTTLIEVGYNCYDIDECEIESICEAGFECVNAMGTFSWIEINECLEKPNPCPHGQSCLNSIGSYS